MIPTTTGGIPIKELKIIIIIFFRKKLYNASIYPNIIAKNEAMNKAVKLTRNDSNMISNNKLSKFKINFIELSKISKIFIYNFYLNSYLTFLFV